MSKTEKPDRTTRMKMAGHDIAQGLLTKAVAGKTSEEIGEGVGVLCYAAIAILGTELANLRTLNGDEFADKRLDEIIHHIDHYANAFHEEIVSGETEHIKAIDHVGH